MTDLTLLGIPGALRAGSTNRLLLAEARRSFGPAVMTEANLRLPLYDGDLEDAQGIPPEVQALADQIRAADAIVIATPEYNKSFPGVLKNALDWVSRTKGGPWRDKPVAILSATMGPLGGGRHQYELRKILGSQDALVLVKPEVFINMAHTKFDGEGRLTDEPTRKMLADQMAALQRWIGRVALK